MHHLKSFKSVEPCRIIPHMERIKSKRNVNNSSRRRKNNTLESVDRISALPDSILGVILSLLPTKNAFTTSTLSKRWKFLWRTVHNLHFCLEDDVDGEDKKFGGFVNHVLLHLDAGVLNKFRLVCTPNCIESHATSWIKTAITRKVHELYLALQSCDAPFDMPISVFSCDSLRSLQLEGWFCLSAATVFCFPRLETLDLVGVTFESDEIFEKMISGCPVLNYLHINMDGDVDDSRFIISSTSLRRLELNLGFNKYLKLEASSLEHLKLCGDIPVIFVQANLCSLVEANFEIYMDFDDDDDDLEAGMCNSMVDAVCALDRAQILTLSLDVMRALSCATINLSADFKRLVKLETSIKCFDCSPLRDFIQSSENLEVLTIYQDRNRDHEHDKSNWVDVQHLRCLSNSLKKVVLNGSHGLDDESEMVSYMLQNGSVLEIMKISCGIDVPDNTKLELLQKISKFPRKSPACQVEFF